MASECPYEMEKRHKLATAQQRMSEAFGASVVAENLLSLMDCVDYWIDLSMDYDWSMQLDFQGLAVVNTADKRYVPHQHLLTTYAHNYLTLLGTSQNKARRLLSIQSLETARRHKIRLFPSGQDIGDPNDSFKYLRNMFIETSIVVSAKRRRGGYFDEGKREMGERCSAEAVAVIDRLVMVDEDRRYEYCSGVAYGMGMVLGSMLAPLVQSGAQGDELLVCMIDGVVQAAKSAMLTSVEIRSDAELVSRHAELVSAASIAKASILGTEDVQ